MDVETAKELLDAASRGTHSTSSLAKALKRKTASVIAAVNEMERCGLLSKTAEKGEGKGRPKVTIRPTRLGSEYLKASQSLDAMPLRADPAGLRRAAEAGRYAARVEAYGGNPFGLFSELNSYVRSAGRAG